MIKAIETEYNGYRFRSRLEARWSVFFDTLGIKYEYEKEGYDLDGVWYLPDFWLPELKRWVEIKGQEPTSEELKRVELLYEGTGYPVIIFYGLPGENDGNSSYSELHSSNGGSASKEDVRWFQCPCGAIDVDIQCELIECNVVNGEWESINGCNCCRQYIPEYYNTPDIIDAYKAARSARFEHGEKP